MPAARPEIFGTLPTVPPSRLYLLGLAVLLLIVGGVSLRRAAGLQFDFHYFYLDADYVWQHGELNPDLSHPDPLKQRQLPFYLPVVPLLLSPLAAGGRWPAAVLWSAGHCVALTCGLTALRRWARPPTAQSHSKISAEAVVALACLLGLPAILEAARFNQLSFFVLALALGGVAALERGRATRAGFLFGFAAVLKLLPAVFLVWLALKRQWRALAVAVATIVIVAALPCLIVFGPQKTLEYHRQWWTHNFHGAPARGMADAGLREHFIDYRNQSAPAVCARLFWADHPHRAPDQPVHLSPATCRWIGFGVLVLLAAALFVQTRRRFKDLTVDAIHAEAAAYGLAMLVFSPLLRQYYLVWALPALVWFCRRAVAESPPAGPPPHDTRVARFSLFLWLAGLLAWLFPIARTYGFHLWLLIALGALLLRRARTKTAVHAKTQKPPS